MRTRPETPLNEAERAEVERLRREAKARLRAGPHDEIEPAEIDPGNPPLTDDQLADLRPAHEVHPQLVADRLRRRGGRPRAETTKQAVSLRLDPDVLEALKAGGPGWQTRVNDMLRKVLGLAA